MVLVKDLAGVTQRGSLKKEVSLYRLGLISLVANTEYHVYVCSLMQKTYTIPLAMLNRITPQGSNVFFLAIRSRYM